MSREENLHRWLALGLLLGIVLLLAAVVVAPLISAANDCREQAEELRFRLQRARQIVARKQSVAENLEKLKRQQQALGFLSSRDTVALASADLQQFVKNAIADAGGQLNSTQVLPVTELDGLQKIAVKVRMKGSIEVLRHVLHEIETSVPLMRVEQLDIRPVRGRRNRKTRRLEPTNELNINFQVVTFMRAQAL